MAKEGGGKLKKLKSVIMKWQSMSKVGRTNRSSSSSSISAVAVAEDEDIDRDDEEGLQAVYVGKSRRRYLVKSDIIDHPIVQELVERSSSESHTLTVGCEVVLFEHLLWMLENADPQPESLSDLVDFYAS